MLVTTTRIIDTPIDRLWALQLDHAHWPEHLPNFQKVEPTPSSRPFGVGTSAAITQPALGTVLWTVDHFEVDAERRSFAWSGSAKGITYTGRHEVEQVDADRTRLTLSITMAGGLSVLFAPLARRTLQKTIDAEAAAFAEWAAARHGN